VYGGRDLCAPVVLFHPNTFPWSHAAPLHKNGAPIARKSLQEQHEMRNY
jgi:hypothetical protein